MMSDWTNDAYASVSIRQRETLTVTIARTVGVDHGIIATSCIVII